jgi:hypothetical protein
MIRDADVENPAAVVRQHQEDIQNLEADRRNGEEVHGHRSREVILQELSFVRTLQPPISRQGVWTVPELWNAKNAFPTSSLDGAQNAVHKNGPQGFRRFTSIHPVTGSGPADRSAPTECDADPRD